MLNSSTYVVVIYSAYASLLLVPFWHLLHHLLGLRSDNPGLVCSDPGTPTGGEDLTPEEEAYFQDHAEQQ